MTTRFIHETQCFVSRAVVIHMKSQLFCYVFACSVIESGWSFISGGFFLAALIRRPYIVKSVVQRKWSESAQSTV